MGIAFARKRNENAVLLVDADPQGGIGHSLTGRAKEAEGLVEVVNGTASADVLIDTKVKGFSILPIGRVPWASLEEWQGRLAAGTDLAHCLAPFASRFDAVS